MVSVLVSRAVDHVFELQSAQTKDYKIGICCLSANYKHPSFRGKSKYWLARKQDMRVIPDQSGLHHHLI